MSDDVPPRDSRNQLPILLGIVGAVLGFIGAVFIMLPSKAEDPVTSGLIALFVFGPIGAVIGAVLGAKLGLLIRPQPPAATPGAISPVAASAGSTTGNALKALGIAFGATAALLGGYVF